MDDLPKKNDSSANQPTTGQWILIASIGGVTILGLIGFLAGGYFTAFPSLKNVIATDRKWRLHRPQL